MVGYDLSYDLWFYKKYKDLVPTPDETNKMVLNYVVENKLLYELNENGEKELVRSTSSNSRAYLRFTNKTSRPVDVWWRDFSGRRHHYIVIDAGGFADINTFITHPWEFTDPATAENFVINNIRIFRAPQKLGGMLFRTNWNITVKVRSLRFSSMLTIARMMEENGDVSALGLPTTLASEIQELINQLHEKVTEGIPNHLQGS